MIDALNYMEKKEKFSEDRYTVDSKGINDLIKRMGKP
jgi:hypothetical protein